MITRKRLRSVCCKTFFWAGNVNYMEHSVAAKKTFESNPDTVKRVGRPNVTF